MDDIPLTVTIAIPSVVGPRYGREGTTPPHGFTTSFRINLDIIDMVDRARALIDPDLTRNTFMTLAVERVARAICQHNDRYQAWIKEKQHERIQSDGAVRPPPSP